MTTTPSPRATVAVLGVGQMGSPMAARLIDAGFHVRLWNRSPNHSLPSSNEGLALKSRPRRRPAARTWC